jgi:hypothetical protein
MHTTLGVVIPNEMKESPSSMQEIDYPKSMLHDHSVREDFVQDSQDDDRKSESWYFVGRV